MDCSNCGGQLPNGALFCHLCGSRQSPSACGGCQTELIPGAAFCSVCGTPVASATQASAAAAERRVSSVLFGDLVSYTTLSEQRDTEDVRDLLTAYFDTCSTVIKRYGGKVEKFIGDAVMAVWGVPLAHEDDAERAVRAGLELVSQVAALGERLGIESLALRVGIVTGEVTATLGAVDQGMVAGDPVNTAARIQSAAGPGEVLVDAATRSLTAAAVTYTDAGEHELKGKTEPVRLHRAGTVVAAVGGLQRMDGLEAPLVGRDRELRLLKELFHATEESGRPHLVVLDGEGGIGKSRIAWELEKYADGLTTAFRWHRGRCLSYGDGVAFWALAEAVRGRLGVVGDEPGSVILGALDRLLDEQVSDDSEHGWLLPRVASLLGEESREFAREDLFAAWTRFFEQVAAGDPLVLVVDDGHHMDEGLAEFLDFLVSRASFSCFVVLLARPELLAARPHLGGRRATPLRLEPLTDAAMGQLVDGLVDGLPAELRSGLVGRAEGIPLYAVETVRALIDRDLVVPVEGRYVVAEGRDLDLSTLGPPASLHALVAARLDALDPAERRVLSDASVLGEAFTQEGIGILATDVPDLDRVLDALVHKQLIAIEVDRFSAERGQYRFVQTVVRQVAYGTLSRRDRRSRHLMVAAHLEGETERADELAQVIAQHLLDAAAASGVGDPEAADLRTRAGDLLGRAAERAAALGSYADAIRLITGALGCLDDPRRRAGLLRRQARFLFLQRRHDEGLPVVEESLRIFEGLGDVVESAESARDLARLLAFTDRDADALALTEAHYAAVVDLDGAEGVQARLLTFRASLLHFSGRVDEAEELLRTALKLLDGTDDHEAFLMCCNLLALTHGRHGSQRVARMLMDGMATHARQVEEWFSVGIALANAGVLCAPVDLPGAQRYAEEAAEVLVGHGFPVDDVIQTNRIAYAWLSGRWDVVRQGLVEVSSSQVPLRVSARTGAGVADLLRWAGADVPDFPAAPEDDYEGIYQGVQEFAGGAAALARGDLPAAVDQLTRAVAKEIELGGLLVDLMIYWPLVLHACRAAGVETPAEVWDPHREILKDLPSTVLAGHALVHRALVAAREQSAEPTTIEADLREGLAILDRCGAVVWRARAEEDLGRWLAGQGRGEEAGVLLESATATYRALGATNWLERAEGSAFASDAASVRLQ